MGTDIHPYVEVRDDAGWRLLETIGRGEYVTKKPAFTEAGDGWIQTLDREKPSYSETNQLWDTLLLENGDPVEPEILIWDDRCYDLFACLASVRNGRGFAGIVTGSGFNPIDDPRGLPNDLAPGNDIYERGYHSCSWLTVDEILAYDWSQTTEQTGWVDEENYREWWKDRNCQGYPRMYSGSVSGDSIRHIDEQMMRNLIDGKFSRDPDPNLSWYTQFLISTTYRDTLPAPFFTMCERLKDRYGEGNVRLVFGFDS